jgi:curli biogenesis system outer membrane secretion channel CsgG
MSSPQKIWSPLVQHVPQLLPLKRGGKLFQRLSFFGRVAGCVILNLLFSGCLYETEFAPVPRRVRMESERGKDQRAWVALGEFKCHSLYVRRKESKDQIQDQARAILVSHLEQSKNFRILDPDRVSDASKSKAPGQLVQPVKAHRYVIAGDIVEFGRKETSGSILWGILTEDVRQVAYAKVHLNVLDASTSEVLHSVQGAGQHHFSARENLAWSFQGHSTYDWVISGKVLDLAVVEAINRLTSDIAQGKCRLD